MGASEKVDSEASQPPGLPGSGPGAAPPAGSLERFDEILTRLRGVVEKLEGGNLSLEDSLKFFEEGIGLCRRGATILDSAERKVEVLLAGSGGSATKDLAPAQADVPTGDED